MNRSSAKGGRSVILDRFTLLERADTILSSPPSLDWIVRPIPRGDLVARFVLSTQLCKTSNATRHATARMQGAIKSEIWSTMLAQAGGLQDHPVSARPQVICVRFSTHETDPYSDWAKAAVDMLRMWRQRRHKIGSRIVVTKIRGLGYIAEDSGRHIDLHQHWEPAKRGEGFVLIEVWTGAEI